MAAMKAAGKKMLIPFLTAGDPNLAVTEKLMGILAENGADVIELGVPFSDPLADGPVLQAAAVRALEATTTLDDVFLLVSRFRKQHEIPVILLIYYNVVHRRGVETFCRAASAAGVSALIVPDLPFEEAGMLDLAATKYELINIRFLAPTTSGQRLGRICKSAAGFIYCVTVTGVTGEHAQLDSALLALLERARSFTGVPLALGFGISTPKQAADVSKYADAVIVGSALVKRIAEVEDNMDKYVVAAEFIRSLKEAIAGGGTDVG